MNTESQATAPKGAGGVEVLAVTDAQFDRIESAWRICSYGNGRKATGRWSRTFHECVAEVLGYEPPESFALAKAGGES